LVQLNFWGSNANYDVQPQSIRNSRVAEFKFRQQSVDFDGQRIGADRPVIWPDLGKSHCRQPHCSDQVVCGIVPEKLLAKQNLLASLGDTYAKECIALLPVQKPSNLRKTWISIKLQLRR
jgi:hypothetical protein